MQIIQSFSVSVSLPASVDVIRGPPSENHDEDLMLTHKVLETQALNMYLFNKADSAVLLVVQKNEALRTLIQVIDQVAKPGPACRLRHMTTTPQYSF